MQASARRSRSTRPLPYPVRFAVLGGGSFGLALASVLGKKSIPVTILVRKQDVAEHINLHHRHPTYLSDIALAPTIRATTNPEEALKDASFIIHAVPVQYSRKFLEDIAPHVPKNTPIISTSKVRALILPHLRTLFSCVILPSVCFLRRWFAFALTISLFTYLLCD